MRIPEYNVLVQVSNFDAICRPLFNGGDGNVLRYVERPTIRFVTFGLSAFQVDERVDQDASAQIAPTREASRTAIINQWSRESRLVGSL